jgi:hypothetical protein
MGEREAACRAGTQAGHGRPQDHRTARSSTSCRGTAEPGHAARDEVGLRRMHGKVVVITGATSGIGQIAAEALAAQGARIVLVARKVRQVRMSAMARLCDGSSDARSAGTAGAATIAAPRSIRRSATADCRPGAPARAVALATSPAVVSAAPRSQCRNRRCGRLCRCAERSVQKEPDA